MCPNSSLSISSSGIAAQLSSMNGAAAAAAQAVDTARDEFLAGTVLAEDQHAPVGRRRHRDLFAELAHRIALPHHRHALVDSGAKGAVLGFEPPLADGIADDEHRLFQRERLLDEVVGAEFDRADGGLDVAVPGDHHHRRVDAPVPQLLERDEAVHARQPDVEHDHVEGGAHDAVEAGFTAVHRFDGIAFVAEDAAEGAADARPHRPRSERSASCLGSWKLEAGDCQHGNSMVKIVPEGALPATSMAPPCSAMMRRTIARPNPLPRCLVE